MLWLLLHSVGFGWWDDPDRDPYQPDPDPWHGLDALMERQGHKPWDLYWRDGELLSRRTIFRDRRFGTWVWMIDDSPSVEIAGTSSVWPAWNADGSRLRLPGRRVGPDGEAVTGWMANADFSRLTHVAWDSGDQGLWRWDRRDPVLLYRHSEGQLDERNLHTGETRVIASWEPYHWAPFQCAYHPGVEYAPGRPPRARLYLPEERTLYYITPQPRAVADGRLVWTPNPSERIYGMTGDQRFFFLETPNGGLWLTYEGEPVDQRYNRRHIRSITECERWGNVIRVRAGVLIDRESGAMDPVIAPADGDEVYLRVFLSGRVRFPSGEGWDDYRVLGGETLDDLFAIHAWLPDMTHGHWSSSPCREYLAKDGSRVRIYRERGGVASIIDPSPGGGNYHVHWVKHPLFFVGWIRGWTWGEYARPPHANIVFQFFTDATFQPVVDTKHYVTSTYSSADFSMQSPDATKIHFGSNMTGRPKNYVAVMARPRPPVNVRGQTAGSAVTLQWDPPRYRREIRGYLVYRSERSGDGYALRTPEPVPGTEWRDDAAIPGTPYYYVVSSLEHSGLESGYSAEAARIGLELPGSLTEPLTVYVEAEEALRGPDGAHRGGLAMGADRWEASDGYYLYRHPSSEEGSAILEIPVPADGTYHLWARLRGEPGASWKLETGGRTFVVDAGSEGWTWGIAGTARLAAGRQPFILSTDSAQAALDLLCLTTAGAFEPEGPRPEKRMPPPPVRGLRAENIRPRVNHLRWEAPEDPTFSHYQVYAAREPLAQPSQERLIGSPTDPEFFDWGLPADTMVYYTVTAVDRRGNESAPAGAQAATPPGEPPVTRILKFAEAAREGPFEESEGKGTLGAFYVVPEDPEANTVSWTVDLPRSGPYYLWLRHLPRGEAGRRTMGHYVDVLWNGEPLTVLGGGATDINAPDRMLAGDHPMAERLWTWDWPGDEDLETVKLAGGTHVLRLERLVGGIRYDALVITSEPSWRPDNGRLRNRFYRSRRPE